MKYDDDYFGTMYDFNGDGHTDISEEYLAFQMMNDAEEEDDRDHDDGLYDYENVKD